MFKKVSLLILPFAAASCSWFWGNKAPQTRNFCPMVMVKQDNLHYFNNSVEIRLKGYDAHCYYNDNIKGTIAVIIPYFEVQRHTASLETDIHFAYYTETLKGPPEYLGRKTGYMSIDTNPQTGVKEVKGKPIEVRIPDGMEQTFSINLGLTAKKKTRI